MYSVDLDVLYMHALELLYHSCSINKKKLLSSKSAIFCSYIDLISYIYIAPTVAASEDKTVAASKAKTVALPSTLLGKHISFYFE